MDPVETFINTLVSIETRQAPWGANVVDQTTVVLDGFPVAYCGPTDRQDATEAAEACAAEERARLSAVVKVVRALLEQRTITDTDNGKGAALVEQVRGTPAHWAIVVGTDTGIQIGCTRDDGPRNREYVAQETPDARFVQTDPAHCVTCREYRDASALKTATCVPKSERDGAPMESPPTDIATCRVCGTVGPCRDVTFGGSVIGLACVDASTCQRSAIVQRRRAMSSDAHTLKCAGCSVPMGVQATQGLPTRCSRCASLPPDSPRDPRTTPAYQEGAALAAKAHAATERAQEDARIHNVAIQAVARGRNESPLTLRDALRAAPHGAEARLVTAVEDALRAESDAQPANTSEAPAAFSASAPPDTTNFRAMAAWIVAANNMELATQRIVYALTQAAEAARTPQDTTDVGIGGVEAIEQTLRDHPNGARIVAVFTRILQDERKRARGRDHDDRALPDVLAIVEANRDVEVYEALALAPANALIAVLEPGSTLSDVVEAYAHLKAYLDHLPACRHACYWHPTEGARPQHDCATGQQLAGKLRAKVPA